MQSIIIAWRIHYLTDFFLQLAACPRLANAGLVVIMELGAFHCIIMKRNLNGKVDF